MSESGTVTISTEEYLDLVQKASSIHMFMNSHDNLIRDYVNIQNQLNDVNNRLCKLENK